MTGWAILDMIGKLIVMWFALYSSMVFIRMIVGIIIGLILFASARMNRMKSDFLWGIFGFTFPIIAIIVYWIVSRKYQKKFCMINEPCFKSALNMK